MPRRTGARPLRAAARGRKHVCGRHQPGRDRGERSRGGRRHVIRAAAAVRRGEAQRARGHDQPGHVLHDAQHAQAHLKGRQQGVRFGSGLCLASTALLQAPRRARAV